MSELSKLVEQLNQSDQPIAQADPELKQAIVKAHEEERENEFQCRQREYELRHDKWAFMRH